MPSPPFVGLISDTHSLVRPEALEALRGAAIIVHAGDIGSPAVLEELRTIAPVHPIVGNIDCSPWSQAIPETLRVEFEELSLYLIHNIAMLDVDPKREGIDVVVYGHSHQPAVETRDGVMFVNPGSAGPRRFSLPIGVGRLYPGQGGPRAELIELSI